MVTVVVICMEPDWTGTLPPPAAMVSTGIWRATGAVVSYIGDGLDVTQGDTGGAGQLVSLFFGIGNCSQAGLGESGGLIGNVEGDAVDGVGAGIDAGVEQSAQFGEVTHGDVDGVVDHVDDAGNFPVVIILLLGVDAEVGGLDVLVGHTGSLDGDDDGLGVGVIVGHGDGGAGILGMDADGDIGDIGGEGDHAGAGDGNRALGRLGLDGDGGRTTGSQEDAEQQNADEEKEFGFHWKLLERLSELYTGKTLEGTEMFRRRWEDYGGKKETNNSQMGQIRNERVLH